MTTNGRLRQIVTKKQGKIVTKMVLGKLVTI